MSEVNMKRKLLESNRNGTGKRDLRIAQQMRNNEPRLDERELNKFNIDRKYICYLVIIL